jgi:hypothetical protein
MCGAGWPTWATQGLAAFTRRQAYEPVRAQQNTRDEPFSLTVDQYGRMWLHAKLEGLEVTVDLARRNKLSKLWLL